MGRPRHSSPNIVRILALLASADGGWRHGYDISQALGISSGSLYPALIRLSDDGLLTARWEIPEAGGRPRHLYRITERGIELARLGSSPAPSGRPLTSTVSVALA